MILQAQTNIFKKNYQTITCRRQIFLLKSNQLLSLINPIYEYAPQSFRNLFVKVIKYAGGLQKDFMWTLYISNGNQIQVPIIAGDIKSWQLAQSYKWHDIGLKQIEEVLNEIIPIEEVYLDIGANLGVRSLYALSLEKPVYLFEPNPA